MKLIAITSWDTFGLISFETLHDKRNANSMSVKLASQSTSRIYQIAYPLLKPFYCVYFEMVLYGYTQDSSHNNAKSYSSILPGYIDLVCKSFCTDRDDNFKF